jgi:Spy/CpxP family protein refolding chaperone
MTRTLNFKLAALTIIFSLLVLAPAIGQVSEDLGKKLCTFKAKTLQELQIGSDKEKKLTDMEEKCVATRTEIIAKLQKGKQELQAALAAPKPDEAKVKVLVKAYVDAQTELFNSYKAELDEELALMTPVQQGKYLMALEKWRQDVCLPSH